jgi:hypothetical protein
MLCKRVFTSVCLAICFSTAIISRADAQEHRDIVNGNLIQFNDNGAWCWYQDERGVVDTAKGKIIVASVTSAAGVGGSPVDGDLRAVIFDLNTMTPQEYLLRHGGGNFYCDDHHAPAVLVRPDGKYLAMYAAHFNDTTSYYRIYDGDQWGPENGFNWNRNIPGGSNFQTTYSNLYYLSIEGRTYNFARAYNRSPNCMVSTNMGDTWTYGGQLTTIAAVGYVDGYFKYMGNGADRIDFVCAEHHPDDYNTSIYHGYIKDAKTYKSDGTLLDPNLLDNNYVPEVTDFTTVFAAGTVINGMTMYRCWDMDVQRYDDGTVATIISARINNNEGGSSITNANHAFIYCRYDGTEWSYTSLGQAGYKLYSTQEDYTGLAAMCPNDSNTIYISTSIDPRDTADLGVHEIFEGVTSDHGKTWQWFPITQNSVRDNLRPIIPVWDDRHTAVMWFRGRYNTAQSFDAAIVGIIDDKSSTPNLMTYVDASHSNTTLSNGNPFMTTGPDSNAGANDNQWHERTGFVNGGSVFTSSETGNGENAPTLKTQIILPQAGTYDIWVNFWANPTADWRIKAGLSESNMQVFRSMACKEVDEGAHSSSIVLTGSDNTFLYQAYVGRVEATAGDSIAVCIDDESILTGSSSRTAGDIARTWYDGVSYARVDNSISSVHSKEKTPPEKLALIQNYPNPFNPTTTITYSLPTSSNVVLTIYNVMGQKIKTLVNTRQNAGNYEIQWNGSNEKGERVSSGVYLYQLKTDSYSEAKKMVLLQ